ncbi:hypothetical protein BO94DRAFT_586161 [Aspergillus sclerotioniger CBS 115572]|uniref:Tat pathway signal sequence n=1 Tax=Aspergillus sclerotioniger CBS 115572 TaxID=1450535 RepID=A0A317WJE7_9EURO|nr:hypothetical protein BO94DRAFT_586161 [Aspergillus sclerotioniger CBS 115572]PWY86576.1 hypothetical protein BO94DRAFT_586161 [Aspergillus sclerotioniger CBS 115572]
MSSSEYHLLEGVHSVDDDEKSPEHKFPLRGFLSRSPCLIVLHAILFISSLALFILSIRVNTTSGSLDTSAHGAQQGLFEDLLSNYLIENFSNDPGSICRGPPSEEGDEAWDRIVQVGPFELRTEDFPSSNLTSYLNNLDQPQLAHFGVFHQLHCLKTLWQYTYFDYYKSQNKIFQLPEQDIHSHLDHCVDFLRQALMCQSDTSIITFHSAEGYDLPVPSYEVPRTCSDFESIRTWVLDRKIDLSRRV